MTDKAAFVQHWKRLQLLMGAFAVLNLATIFLNRAFLPVIWIVFLPVWMVLLWRLRCWNCGQRLMKDGGAHIEWRGHRFSKWKLARHKTCGADLS